MTNTTPLRVSVLLMLSLLLAGCGSLKPPLPVIEVQIPPPMDELMIPPPTKTFSSRAADLFNQWQKKLMESAED
jgi:hypothetical protein